MEQLLRAYLGIQALTCGKVFFYLNTYLPKSLLSNLISQKELVGLIVLQNFLEPMRKVPAPIAYSDKNRPMKEETF